MVADCTLLRAIISVVESSTSTYQWVPFAVKLEVGIHKLEWELLVVGVPHMYHLLKWFVVEAQLKRIT